jgi:tripartite-type tricarboxylate transporter receptor subunit TctC
MMFPVLKGIAATLAAAAALASTSSALAQSYPTKPVNLKVAYPASGPADSAARRLQPALQAALGQPVIVENQPGAGGSIATMNVLNAPADGHTLLVITGNDAILAPLTLASARYKASALKLVAVVLPAPFVLVSNTTFSFKSVDEYIEFARKPGQKEPSFGTWGYGSIPHLVGEDFKAITGARMLDVPYKGVAPVVQDLLGNQVDMAFLPLGGNVLGLIESGKVKPIGIASAKRSPYMPNVPSLNESKYLKNFEYTAWAAVFVPVSVSDAIVTRLNREITEIVRAPDYQKYLRDTAATNPEPMDMTQAAAFYKGEMDKLGRIAKQIKLEPQ